VDLKLRGYQQDIFDKATEAFRNGAKGICCVLPCRSGKSYIMARMIQGARGNVLVLAHRHTLINQHKELLAGLGVLTEKVRVASVFTEAKRLGQFDQNEFNLIIIDEAHLSEAASYRKVCEYYDCRRVLFTATPSRLDGKPLTLADTLITGITATELIKMGAISEYDYYAPDLNLDTESVDMVAGEYHNGQLSDLMCQSAIYGDVLKYYQLLGENRQAIAYCTSIKHSKQTAESFIKNGISAISIDGSMSLRERDKLMSLFVNGKAQILCNCNLISEGVTLPNASVALLLRPTLSLPLFIQQSCRVLTPVDGKKAVIIDFVNNCQKHGLPTDTHNWSLTQQIEKRKEFNSDGTLNIRQCANCFRRFQGKKCPYCGVEHVPKGRELKQMQEVELKKIEAIEKEEEEKQKKDARREQGMCKTYQELYDLAKKRGYKNPSGWAYFIMKGRK
jgi:superfamily II DNA or RNA helicase